MRSLFIETNLPQSSLMGPKTCVVLTVCRTPAYCLSLDVLFYRDVSGWGENESAQVRLGVDKHSKWTTFRPEKTAYTDIAAKKRKNSPCELKWQADKARSRTRVNLSLAFTYFKVLRRGWGWRATWSLPANCWTGGCQTTVVSLCWLAKSSTFPLKHNTPTLQAVLVL